MKPEEVVHASSSVIIAYNLIAFHCHRRVPRGALEYSGLIIIMAVAAGEDYDPVTVCDECSEGDDDHLLVTILSIYC